jgi:Cu2+-exporting ATPase
MGRNMSTLTEEVRFPVTGMSCAACAASVESMINAQDGVDSAQVNYGTASVGVSYNPKKISLKEIQAAVQSVGYDLIITEDTEEASRIFDASKKSAYRRLKSQTLGAIALALPIMIISMGFPNIPWANEIMLGLSLPVVGWFGRGFFLRSIKQLRHGMMSMDTLVALSTGIALIFSLFNTIYPTYWERSGLTAHVYYEAAAAIISFVLLGKLLEERAKNKTGKAIKKLLALQPSSVTRIKTDGSFENISINEISIGDQILVKPGEKIPVDGEVINGSSFIDESMITGEPMPVKKAASSKVYTGTINQKGSLTIKTEKVGDQTLLAQIIKMVQKAQGSKAPVQYMVDKIAGIFVPAVLVISVISFITWMILGGDHALSYALLTSVSVLVIACPCALGLATPTAIIVGMGRGAENNILIKNAESLELFKSIDTIVFDKTGTITVGSPVVQKEIWFTKNNKTHLNEVLLAIEAHSEHPLAEAILNHFKPIDKSPAIDNFQSLSGMGVIANCREDEYAVGNAQLLERQAIKIEPEIKNQVAILEKEGQTVVYFSNTSEVLAIIAIGDRIKENARAVLDELHTNGVQTLMLTGDTAGTAEAVAGQTGIGGFHAGLQPHHKAEIIKELQRNGHKVAMVGDGINDSEALALADVSIAMGSGADIAIEVAQITLRSSNLNLLPKAIGLSQQTSKTINQNLFWAFIYNLVGIPIAAGILYPFNEFLLNPMIAAAAMAFSSVSVVSNSLFLNKRSLTMRPIKQNNSITKPENKMSTYTFKTNINCNGCIASVTPKLEALEGINQWSVDTENPEKILTVETSALSAEDISEAVKSAGFSIETVE